MKKKQIVIITFAKFVPECSKTLLSIMFRLGYFVDKRLLNIVKEYITGAIAGVGEDDAGGHIAYFTRCTGGARDNIAIVHPYQLQGLRCPAENEAEGVNERRVRMRIDV
ncbi:uncharacterized protein LOC105431879 [Pogonomyrmex barbatus]|uniref:Uncharacterized protein LOC105431879 n=1 Tax=Pogonomyrmex barbatus TaxID=144034 RepID=A0A6I9XGT8_9HYME|nr:uncharacterized protein LOC105431879 [Pogonomyrmex barbatus]